MSARRLGFYFVTTLTLGRVPLIGCFLAINLLLRPSNGHWVLSSPASHAVWFTLAFGALALCALSDLLDGFCARWFGTVTRLGTHADPMTDQVFFLTSLPTLVLLACLHGQVLHGQLLLLLTVVFVMRDQWVSFLRSIGAIYQAGHAVNWSGKARALLSFPTVCGAYWYLQAPAAWGPRVQDWYVYALEGLCLAINVVSAAAYTVQHRRWIAKELESVRQATAPRPQDSQA